MKYQILILAAFSMLACKNNVDTTDADISEVKEETMPSNELNFEVADTIDGGTMLLGPINRKGLTKTPYKEWFDESKNNHTLDTTAIANIKPLLDGVQLKVFMGTWCEDSQREVPALYQILDATDFNYNNMEVVAVTHDKDTPSGLEKRYNIEYVPTIIFIKNGDTLNRIVEYAHGTLEQDMLTILSGEDYTPAYSE